MLARYGTQESPRTLTQCAYARGDLSARSQRVVHASGGSQVASAIEPSPSALAVAYVVLPGQSPSAMGHLSSVTLLARLIGRSAVSHHRPAALSWRASASTRAGSVLLAWVSPCQRPRSPA